MDLDLCSFAKITHHEGAIVCSYETVLDLPLETVEPKLVNLMEMLQTYIELQSGLIGHIKAHAEESGRTRSLSAVGSEVTVLSGQQVQTTVSFTAIVFFVDENQLQRKVEQLFDEITEQ